MPTALFYIGRSGLTASRASLELTAQNVANAANPDYARRTLGQSELVMSASIGLNSSNSLGGVRIGGIERAGSALVQRQARDSASALANASAEYSAMREAETALENSGLFDNLIDFEAALARLESDPLNPALRVSALETARQLAATFGTADNALGNARLLTVSEAEADLLSVRGFADELARVNQDLVAAQEGTASKAALLDQRDAALRGLAEQIGIVPSFNANGTVDVTLSGSPPAALVQGGSAIGFDLSVAPDGILSFEVDGQPYVPMSGAMAGRAAALGAIASLQTQLDGIAVSTVSLVNAAQGTGVAADGTPGQPIFAGTAAADITIVLGSGAGIATATAGAPAGSRDTTNLGGLITALGNSTGPTASVDALLLGLSSRVAGLDSQREGLGIVAASAEAELLRETGVDLDEEAANLVRLQQAFEANGRVIQVASEIFDVLLGLR